MLVQSNWTQIERVEGLTKNLGMVHGDQEAIYDTMQQMSALWYSYIDCASYEIYVEYSLLIYPKYCMIIYRMILCSIYSAKNRM